MTDLWVEASRDVEAELFAQRMAYSKVAVASLWPFLASASSEGEFAHRLALSYDTIASRVEPELLDPLVASLKEDYQLLRPTPIPSRAVVAGVTERSSSQPTAFPTTAPLSAGMQFWHAGSQKWVQAVSDPQNSPHNSAYDVPTSEAGPETGETGTFPIEVSGPDPWNPMNGKLPLPASNVIPPANRFPAQPQQWIVPPNAGWVENPMQFAPYRSAQLSAPPTRHVTAAPQLTEDGPLAYTDEGVQTGTGQNPYYFAQGNEGLQSQDGQFPPDVALPEPDERVEMYRNAVPNAAMMGYEQGYLAALQRQGEYHYIHEQSPGDWVITQKGTGKVLSHHDSEEKAQEAFRAMEWSKHSGAVTQQVQQFFDPTHPTVLTSLAAQQRQADQGVANGNYLTGNPYLTGGDQPTPSPLVQAPPSTQQGGPGAEAMPPLVSPDSTVPTSNASGGMGPADPGGSDAAAKTGVRVARQVMHRVAEEYRERPTQYNPTGAGDDYTARTWENQLTQNPRQDIQERAANTPQRPAAPIPTISSSDRLEEPAQSDEEMDERDNEREASLTLYSGIGRNGQPPLTRSLWQPSPKGGAAENSLSKIINASVRTAVAQAGGRR